MLGDKSVSQKPSASKIKVGKEFKEVIKPQIKRAVKKPSQQNLMIYWILTEIWTIFILALIQKVKRIVTAIRMLNVLIFLKNRNRR